jgi:hypothetical protein
VTRYVQHWQGVGGPDTGFAVDFDWQLRGDLGHGNLTPEKFVVGAEQSFCFALIKKPYE